MVGDLLPDPVGLRDDGSLVDHVRWQQDVVEYLLTENQVLKEKLGKIRILLSDDQRRRLAVKGKTLGRKRLAEIGTLFSPDTILPWHLDGQLLVESNSEGITR